MAHRMQLQFLCSPESLTPPPANPQNHRKPTSFASSSASSDMCPVSKSFKTSAVDRRLVEKGCSNYSSSSQITASNLVHDPRSNSRMRICNQCSLVFSRKVRYLYHLLKDHDITVYEGRSILPCTQCESAFIRNTDRSKHVQCVHKRLRPFPCPLPNCDSSFFFSKDLSKHTNTVHLRHRPFRCDKCGQSFGKREHMTSHVRRVHHRVRPFKCPLCNISLASKYNLEGHFNTVGHRTALQMAELDSTKSE